MSTPLTDGINALTAYANEVTGASDTTLSDAVESLVAGYGGGSGSAITSGTYTPTADTVDFTLDVGVTGWTHYLIVKHELPLSAVASGSFFALEYADFTSGIMMNAHGKSNATTPSAVSFFQTGHSYFPTVSGSVITRRGSSGYHGYMYASQQYDWYVW